MNILVFEDEIYSYRLLRNMLEDMDPSYNILGPISSIVQGKDYFSYNHDIDIIIADIQLNDGLIFHALEYIPDDVPIIFTTAYEEYALRAFNYNSLSYLLKPFDEEDLALAMTKAMKLHGNFEVKTHNLSRRGDNSIYRERFVVKAIKGEKVIPVSNVRYMGSEQKQTYLKLFDGRSFVIDMTLEQLASQLDPVYYMRVNRKYIIPYDQVESVERIENGKEKIHLRGNDAPEIIVSRIRKSEVNKWLRK
ncbi:MAG: response regulator transcription factor [Bacteroidaceae bacterium]|nr:response regulator transcription factor [Bacteroidaceae bacterium]